MALPYYNTLKLPLELTFYSHFITITFEIPPHIYPIGPIVSISPHKREKMDIQNWNLDHKIVALRKIFS